MKKILLTGASGYIGAHLLKELEAQKYEVRCLARNPKMLASRTSNQTEVIEGDVFNTESLDPAFQNIDDAYYLIHSMGSDGNFEIQDQIAAENFAKSALKHSVKRIFYLGGLAHTGDALSTHLRSRQQVGEILRRFGPQVIEFRASIIIGAGSLSFEMIRSLTERLPVMVTPKWVSQRAQPIAITDVIAYLTAALKKDFSGNPIFEIGGADQLSYREIMRKYAHQRKLKRFMIPVPFLTPGLSSLWLALVTPLYARVGRKLVDSLIHETIVRDDSARKLFGIKTQGISDAIRDALKREDSEMAIAHWYDALSSAGLSPKWGGVRFGSRIIDSRVIQVRASKENAFEPIQRIGGKNGWYFANWLWKLRGWIDLFVGGVGTRRGRTNTKHLRVGDVIDWWRVESVTPGSILLLAAEMKVPGRAWLQFEINENSGISTIRQTAIYDPVGLAGILYWYALYPIHYFIFDRMLKNIGKRAEENQSKI